MKRKIYYKLQCKYLDYCNENESAMEEYYEDYLTAYRNRVIDPAVKRIEAIIVRLGLSVVDFWHYFNEDISVP